MKTFIYITGKNGAVSVQRPKHIESLDVRREKSEKIGFQQTRQGTATISERRRWLRLPPSCKQGSACSARRCARWGENSGTPHTNTAPPRPAPAEWWCAYRWTCSRSSAAPARFSPRSPPRAAPPWRRSCGPRPPRRPPPPSAPRRRATPHINGPHRGAAAAHRDGTREGGRGGLAEMGRHRHRRGRGERSWRGTRQPNLPRARGPASPNGGFFLLRHAPRGHAQPPPPMGGADAAAAGGPAQQPRRGRGPGRGRRKGRGPRTGMPRESRRPRGLICP